MLHGVQAVLGMLPDAAAVEQTAALPTPAYTAYLRSDHWKATRLRAVKRAGFCCERCGTGGRLDVHHKTYRRIGRERPSDLITLCRSCHDLEHPDPTAVLPMLSRAVKPIRVGLIAFRLDLDPNLVIAALAKARRQGLVEKYRRGWVITDRGRLATDGL